MGATNPHFGSIHKNHNGTHSNKRYRKMNKMTEMNTTTTAAHDWINSSGTRDLSSPIAINNIFAVCFLAIFFCCDSASRSSPCPWDPTWWWPVRSTRRVRYGFSSSFSNRMCPKLYLPNWAEMGSPSWKRSGLLSTRHALTPSISLCLFRLQPMNTKRSLFPCLVLALWSSIRLR